MNIDVLILPDVRPEVLEQGYSHRYGDGESIVPPEYRGGLGASGAEAIREFARSGGTLMAFNRAALYAMRRLGLPVDNVVGGLSNQRFFGPGTLVKVQPDLSHPLCHGMRETEFAWFESGPVFRVRRRAGSQVQQVLRYPRRDILASGWLLGERYMANQAAVLDVLLRRGKSDPVRNPTTVSRPVQRDFQDDFQWPILGDLGKAGLELNYFNYFTEVEEHFRNARSSGMFMMSPIDWALVETWKQAGIPLEAGPERQ